MGKRGNKFFRAAGVTLFWVALWHLASLLVNQTLLLPSPGVVAAAFWKLLPTAAFWQTAGFSLLRVIGGLALGFVTAGLLAPLAYRFSFVRTLLSPLLSAVKAAPVASFVILALLWLRGRNLSVFVVFLIVLPILYAGILQGLLNTDPGLLEMAKVFRMPSYNQWRGLYLPAVAPFYAAAMQSAVGLAWKSGVAAEIIALPKGSLGEKIYESKIYLETPQLFAYTLAVIGLSVALERLTIWSLRRWGATRNISLIREKGGERDGNPV